MMYVIKSKTGSIWTENSPTGSPWTENSPIDGIWPKEEMFKLQNKRAINRDTGKYVGGEDKNMDNLRELLKRHEGYSATVYLCSGGKRTIGYGRNIDANPLPKDIQDYLDANGSITLDMAERLLDVDIKVATDSCKALFPNLHTYSENRQNALIDFCFNVGITTALKFKLVRQAIFESDNAWYRAALEFKDSKWFKQTGNRGVIITKMILEG